LSSSPYQLRWSTIAVAPSEANVISGDGTLSPPIYAIQPGKSLNGFEISSSRPPGIAQYFAQGFTQIASGTPTVNNDEPEPSCAGWDFDNPLIETQVTGATVGPSDPSVMSVRIRAREDTGLRPCLPIDPKNPNGKISVLILSTSTFDASEVSVSSIVFGPAYAHPISSKIVPAGVGDKLGFDERAAWEKMLATFQPGDIVEKNTHQKNLLLTFEVSSLDVQCNLDQALFLRGSTIPGQQFLGEVSSNTAGCGPQEIGRHKHHPFPFKWWLPQTVSH
jgi:hypothetical protein